MTCSRSSVSPGPYRPGANLVIAGPDVRASAGGTWAWNQEYPFTCVQAGCSPMTKCPSRTVSGAVVVALAVAGSGVRMSTADRKCASPASVPMVRGDTPITAASPRRARNCAS